MEPSKDNTFCWYPFSLLALKEWREGMGILNASPCCNSIRPETPDPLNVKEKLKHDPGTLMPSDIFYGEEMESIRQAMREGRRHSACETCWRIEDRSSGEGKSSYRLHSIPPGFRRNSAADQDLIKNPKLRSIDFAFGENCNLRCRMCAPGLSNKLRTDYQYFVENQLDTTGIQQFDYRQNWNDWDIPEGEHHIHDHWLKPDSNNIVLNWDSNEQWQNILDNQHTLNHIKATGGETLLTKPFVEFMDAAIDRGLSKNIMLEFHTNATKFTDANIKKLKQFQGLHLNLSIDSLGKNYEYIRYPMPWNKLNSSLRNLLEKTRGYRSPKFEKDWFIKNLSFNVVLSALNAHYLEELYHYHVELTAEFTHFEFTVFYVDLLWPENKYINVKFLPPKVKKDLIKQYERIKFDTHPVVTHMDTAIDFLRENLAYQPTEQDRQNMLREITVFDKSRNQCYSDYLHEDIVEFLETPL